MSAFNLDIEARNLKILDFSKGFQYINKLVDNGILPKELEAEYQVESNDSFTSFVLQMEKLRRVKQDPDVKDSPGSEPAKYFAKGAGGKGMSKSTKQSRARYFDKKAKMSDDNPDAYKPAPGDKGKKTKPSQYTKNFSLGAISPPSEILIIQELIDDFCKISPVLVPRWGYLSLNFEAMKPAT